MEVHSSLVLTFQNLQCDHHLNQEVYNYFFKFKIGNNRRLTTEVKSTIEADDDNDNYV